MELLARSTKKTLLLLLFGSCQAFVDNLSASENRYQGPMRAPDGPYYSSEQLIYPETIKLQDQQLQTTQKSHDESRAPVEKNTRPMVPAPSGYYYPFTQPFNGQYPYYGDANNPYLPYPYGFPQNNPYRFR